MSTYLLKVTESKYLQDWINFISKSLILDINSFDVILVDFGKRNFLETDDVVLLACLLEHFFLADKIIEFKGGSQLLNNHLSRIKFKNYWTDNFNREHFTFLLNNTTFCLWKISKDMISTYSFYAKDYYSKRMFKGKDMSPLISNLVEVFNNIFDHSRSFVDGYIISQYFPKDKRLSFSVCDLGIGIPSSVNEYFKSNKQPRMSDKDALMKSLEQGFTVQSNPRNKGFGLNNILELTESSKGLLRITSNSGNLDKYYNKPAKLIDLDCYLRGTLIRVDVDTSTFEELDYNVKEFEF